MKNDLLPSHAILVVEDDPLLQVLTADMVEESGFVALQADNADAALVILAARPDIAMMVTDVSMPGSMDGVKLARVVHERWPQTGIIVTTARSDVSAADLPEGCRFFRKPYHSDVLISTICALMKMRRGDPEKLVYLDV